MRKQPEPPKTKPGPQAERVKIDMPWQDAMKHALHKPRPKEGLPSAPEKKPKA